MNVVPSVLPLFLTKRFKFWTIAFHSQLSFKSIYASLYTVDSFYLRLPFSNKNLGSYYYDFYKNKLFPYVELSLLLTNFLVPCQFEIERFQCSSLDIQALKLRKIPSASKVLKFSTWSSYIETDAVWFQHSGLNEPIILVGHQHCFVYASQLNWSPFFLWRFPLASSWPSVPYL